MMVYKMDFARYSEGKRMPLILLVVTGIICVAIFLFAFTRSGYASLFQKFETDALGSDFQKINLNVEESKTEFRSSGDNQRHVEPKKNQSMSENVTIAKMDTDTRISKPPVKQQNEYTDARIHDTIGLTWLCCNWKGAIDFIPCLENAKAIKQLHSHRHMEHKERHCPAKGDLKRCLLPLPNGYRPHIVWPQSMDTIWLNNVPHTKLVEYKKDQNWVKISGDFLVFPGGGTQFKTGALQYINFIEEILPNISWGKRTRIVLDVGCGVASFGGYLFDKNVLTMSFAPNDGHEAQIQLALERGIPAILSVIGTQRLLYPGNAYDAIHCARCRVHWHGDGGIPLLEMNRVLRPGGYFIWSATPVYRNEQREREVWEAVNALARSICWTLVLKRTNYMGIGIAIYQKPASNTCYMERKLNDPPFCQEEDNQNAAWYVPMQRCIHKISRLNENGFYEPPPNWPLRLEANLHWPNHSLEIVKGTKRDFFMDIAYWRDMMEYLYFQNFSMDWSTIRNVMDMKADYGGFASSLIDKSVWVMNVVPASVSDTLPLIYERGLIGIYHDWCESFNTYPRTYDLLHAYHILSILMSRCDLVDVIIEMDRILRPHGWAIVHDNSRTLEKILPLINSLHWNVTYNSGNIIAAQKTFWRPPYRQS